jgi:hypothetical protein
MYQTTTRIFKNTRIQQQKEQEPTFISTYVIRDIPHAEYAKLHQLMSLPIPLEECADCTQGIHYTDAEEALQHLLQFHVKNMIGTRQFSRAKMIHWISSSPSASIEMDNQVFIKLLRTLTRRVESLQTQAIDIRNSVADANKEKPRHYLLPSSLVEAAEKIFEMAYTVHYSFPALYIDITNVTTPNRRELATHIALIQDFGSGANTALSNARHDLLLMAYTGNNRASMRNIRSTPETTLLFCLRHLSSRQLIDDLCALDLYREHLSSMVSVSP